MINTVLNGNTAWKKGGIILRFAELDDLGKLVHPYQYLGKERDSYLACKRTCWGKELIIGANGDKIIALGIYLKSDHRLEYIHIDEKYREKKIYLFHAIALIMMSLLNKTGKDFCTIVLNEKKLTKIIRAYREISEQLDIKMTVNQPDKDFNVKIDFSVEQPHLEFNKKARELLGKWGWGQIELQ